MPLAAGTRLGSFEVLAPLGAGGMGEVWRARDTRLSREVAVKILPAEVAADAGRLKRFEKEARAASALNHPNIVTIYDIGSSDSLSFIAMELVAGKTLREHLLAGPLPVKKILAISSQIADGLARAHERGIVHRDLKPENVMVTKDGLVKILDFGLAKQTGPVSGSDEGSHLPTETGTSPGVVLGTVGYMSPEQAAGQLVDFRSDQFSFGSILYEMATGKRAFQKGTAVDTLSAILHEEPRPIGAVNPEAPTPLRWIVDRCLSKEPKGRYASTEDLARDLAATRDRLSEVSAAAEAGTSASTHRSRRLPSLAAVALVAALVAGWAIGRYQVGLPEPDSPVFRRLTFRHGNILHARFTADGQTVVYSAAFEGNPPEIFSARADATGSRALGIPRADLLAVSPKGELAILLLKNEGSLSPGDAGTLARVSLGGGAPREILEGVFSADWAPDGEELAVLRRTSEGKSRIEFPIGHSIVESDVGMSGPRVSPDGQLVAFAEPTVDGKVVVAIVSREGKRRNVSTGWRGVTDVAWSRSGRELFFMAAKKASNGALYAIDLSGHERVLWYGPPNLFLQDRSADGRLLLERGSGRRGVLSLAASESREKQLAWLDGSGVADVSEDGRMILFGESGEGAGPKGDTYVRATDGSPAIRLGDGDPQSLSPDGKWALTLARSAPPEIVLLPTGPGVPKRIPVEGTSILPNTGTIRSATFLPDGKQIAVIHSPEGKDLIVSILGLEGGAGRVIKVADASFQGGTVFSPDGRLLACVTNDRRVLVVPVSGGSPRAVPSAVLESSAVLLQWGADGRFLYCGAPGELSARIFRLDVETGQKTLWRELQPADRSGVISIDNVCISRDGRSYAYNYTVVDTSDLYLVEGLK